MVQTQHLEQKIAVLTRLTEISTILNSTLELDSLLAYLMDVAAEITSAEAASVLLWDKQRQELYFAATTTNTAGLNLIGQPVPLDGSIAGTIMQQQRGMRVDDARSDPRHYPQVDAVSAFETRSILGVPLQARDEPIGVLEVLNRHRLPWTDDDEMYLAALAAQAAVAIRSAQLVAALQKANAELSELDKLKNDFIAIASHELRTPLGVILGYAGFLAEAEDSQVSVQAGKVVNSALQLRRIIEDMTNLRYIKHNPDELLLEAMTVNELLDSVRSDILTLCETKGHDLTIHLPAAPDIQVYADRIAAAMALSNVLTNAVRFTPANGRITITAEVRRAELWIIVQDSGIGLTADQCERIFEEFYQVEDHMNRRHGGLGIGLSISRALIAAHGGRIWATSPGLNQGATFTLTLPLADSTTRDRVHRA